MPFDPITAAQRLEYTNNVALALQQDMSTLEQCATYQPNLKGKQSRVIELFGARGGQRNPGRGATIQPTPGSVEQVWCRPQQFVTEPFVLEKEDDIKNATTYPSSYVQSDAASINRFKDTILAEALISARILGEDGTETAAYSNPNGSVPINYVLSGSPANSGLTVGKIIKGLELLEEAEVKIEREPIFLQATSRQMTDLYADLMFVNKDYREKAIIDEGRKLVRELLGVKIIRMPKTYVPIASTTRTLMMWAKSGLHYGEFSPVESTLERSVERFNRVVGFSEIWVGATRSEDAKFVQIACSEA